MQLASYEFIYNPENLKTFSYSIFGGNSFDINILLIYFGIIACTLILYIISPYMYGFFLVIVDNRLKIRNKNKIQELILMKEIQGELEEEMEQALLNAAFIKKQEG